VMYLLSGGISLPEGYLCSFYHLHAKSGFKIQNTEDAVKAIGIAKGTLVVLKNLLERLGEGEDLDGIDLSYLAHLCTLSVEGLNAVTLSLDDLLK